MKQYIFILIYIINIQCIDAQIKFNREIIYNNSIEKPNDTLRLKFKLTSYKKGEICRIQQKIKFPFEIIKEPKTNAYQYFEKDAYTLIWTSLPKDTSINFFIDLKAPKLSQGYIYIGEAACMYGGYFVKPTRVYLKPEKIYLSDTSSVFIAQTDTSLYNQIDSIVSIKPPKINKNKKLKFIETVKTDKYYFRIQITATKHKQNIKDISIDKIAGDFAYEEFIDDIYKYTYGNFKTYKEALKRLERYKKEKNITGFIVAYKNDIRVGIKEAQTQNIEPEQE